MYGLINRVVLTRFRQVGDKMETVAEYDVNNDRGMFNKIRLFRGRLVTRRGARLVDEATQDHAFQFTDPVCGRVLAVDVHGPTVYVLSQLDITTVRLSAIDSATGAAQFADYAGIDGSSMMDYKLWVRFGHGDGVKVAAKGG